jgi:hypothetical protein
VTPEPVFVCPPADDDEEPRPADDELLDPLLEWLELLLPELELLPPPPKKPPKNLLLFFSDEVEELPT